jgi:pyruvate/2-oxoacid:ferredoxin oxidoreductase beta subunit/ferredoxin
MSATQQDTHAPLPQAFPDWYDSQRAKDVVEAYNSGSGSSQVADEFLAKSILPASTGALRDFSYIAPELPEFNASNCVGCMDCVNNCPDTAILGKAVTEETLEAELAKATSDEQRDHLRGLFAETVKYYKSHQKKHEKDPENNPAGAKFGIFIDPTKCKGCGECVDVCGDHDALKMIKKTPDNLPQYLADFGFYRSLPATPTVYINKKDKRDTMLRPSAIRMYAGGAGSCMGCGEASVLRQMLAITEEVVGDRFGIVASTGCNTVYGSTYPYNPYAVPWTNSLFENGPADAMGIRAFWDQNGNNDWILWNIGGDGAMMDIGFQSLSRAIASGMNIKFLIMDTQVYSNTGGQQSTSSYTGQESKMGAFGKAHAGKFEKRKEIAQILMMHPNVFVGQTIGPMTTHFYKTVERALRYPGPAVINVYTTCQPEHGVGDDKSATQARNAMKSRAFPLLVYDPDAGETFQERLSLDGNPSPTRDWVMEKNADGSETPYTFLEWAKTEGRFKKHFDKHGNTTTEGMAEAMKDRLANWRQLQQLAGITNTDFMAELEAKKAAAASA